MTKGSTSSSLGSKPMARPSKERIETYQKKRLCITLVYRCCWKGGNTIPQTWGRNSGDLFFMTQACPGREDELVEICVTVIYTQLSLFYGLHLFLYIHINCVCNHTISSCLTVWTCWNAPKSRFVYFLYSILLYPWQTYADMIVDRRCPLKAQLGSRCPEPLDWSFEMI